MGHITKEQALRAMEPRPTKAHKAALDALEECVRHNNVAGVSTMCDESLHESVLPTLIAAGRMEWTCERRGWARFVTPPKPRLTAEEVNRAMSIVQEYEGQIAMEPGAPALRTFLTSLTQEGE